VGSFTICDDAMFEITGTKRRHDSCPFSRASYLPHTVSSGQELHVQQLIQERVASKIFESVCESATVTLVRTLHESASATCWRSCRGLPILSINYLGYRVLLFHNHKGEDPSSHYTSSETIPYRFGISFSVARRSPVAYLLSY
jgi:hypothetical protein